jgi:hypothetical protein
MSRFRIFLTPIGVLICAPVVNAKDPMSECLAQVDNFSLQLG